jgi:predicted MFS family arabinose efflux permease
VILATAAGFAIAPLALLGAGQRVAVGLAVGARVSVLGSANGAAEDAMIADLVPEDRRVSAYASVRVAKNLGVSFGPPVGGLLLLGAAWGRLFSGVAVLGLGTWLLAFRLLPRTGSFAPHARPERGSFGVVRRDRAFLVFVGAMSLAWMTYVSYEVLLPISLVRSHGIAPSTWGFLLAVNPICVTLVQVRLTRATARVPAAAKLAVAMPLMGLPFVLLQAEDSVWIVLVLVAVFVVGEMLWVPTSQAVAAAFAPDDLRGAYMGVIGSGSQVAWAVTPFVGLQLRAAFGDAAMWDVVGGVSLVAALAGAAVTRRRRSDIPHIS